jgi:hypothetical protein
MPYREWTTVEKTSFIDKLYRRAFTVADRSLHTTAYATEWKQGQDLRLLSGSLEYYTECNSLTRTQCRDIDSARNRAVIEPQGSSLHELLAFNEQEDIVEQPEQEERDNHYQDIEAPVTNTGSLRTQVLRQEQSTMDTNMLQQAIAAAVTAVLQATNVNGNQ